LGISFGSINTGLPKDIVKQIIDAERIPIKKMEERKDDIAAKKALLSELTGKIEQLNKFLTENSSAAGFREVAVSGNDSIVGITADKNAAQSGNHQFEVVQLAQKSSAMTSGFSDPDNSYVGVGFIQYTLPNGETRDIYIDEENASLRGISKLINQDTSNGMTANVVNDGSDTENPWRLIISLEETGDGQKADFPYFYFVDGEDDFYIEKERPAQDAKIKIDGFEVEYPANKVEDLIPGLTLDLKKAKPGEEFTIGVSEDTQKIGTKIADIVNNINEVFRFIKAQNQMDERTNTKRTLGGDVTLQTLESRLKSMIFTPIKTPEGNIRLGDLGIAFQKDGLLGTDENKLENYMKNNFKGAVHLFTGSWNDGIWEDGILSKLRKFTGETLQVPSGLLRNREKGLSSQISQIDRRIADRERMLEKKEKTLKDKFARLEGTINRIKGQGAGIAALGAGSGVQMPQLG